MFSKNFILIHFGLLFIILFWSVQTTFSQEARIDEQVFNRDSVWRLGFWEILHQTFDDDIHPFYQMTGTSRFKGAKGFFGTTFLDPDSGNLLTNVNSKNEDGHVGQDGTLTKIFGNIPLLKGLPTFSIEYIQPTNYIVGFGLSFAYTNIWLDDLQVKAATTGADPEYSTPLLRMASHFYMIAGSIHPFGVPSPDDLDIFIGFGLSRVESTLRYGIRFNPTIIEYTVYPDQSEITGSSGTLAFRRIGIASGGDNFGVMLEFFFFGRSEIIENPFATNTIIDSNVYNSTYNDTGSTLPSKVGMPGGITRFSWTYSF